MRRAVVPLLIVMVSLAGFACGKPDAKSVDAALDRYAKAQAEFAAKRAGQPPEVATKLATKATVELFDLIEDDDALILLAKCFRDQQTKLRGREILFDDINWADDTTVEGLREMRREADFAETISRYKRKYYCHW